MLGARGYEAFLVGGAVRDYARGQDSAKDWDIATNALPKEVAEVFAGYPLLETGLKHGTVTLVMDHMPLEITTYRMDGDYSDHRHPDSVRFTRSLKEDLLRRDFTINALAYHPDTGIVDLVGGLEDLAQGLIRCVGEPDRRFQEDGLRILRALRFASVYQMGIEEATAAGIHNNKKLLEAIAWERIQAELTKMLQGDGIGPILREFGDVLAVPIPELVPTFGFQQRNPHHDKTVWEHTIAVVSNTPPDPILRWASLLHDLGKPSCFSMDQEGVGHFYGHPQKSAALAEEILSRLRFDTASRLQILELVQAHDLPISPSRKPLKRLIGKLGADRVKQLIELRKADVLGQAAPLAGRIQTYEQVRELLDQLLSEEGCFSLKDLKINGRDLVAMGFQGKEIGAALRACLWAVIEEQVPNRREALIELAKNLPQQGLEGISINPDHSNPF